MGGAQRKNGIFRVEDALAMRVPAHGMHIGLTADGEWAAYTTCEPPRGQARRSSLYLDFSKQGVSMDVGRCTAWAVDCASGETVRLAAGTAVSWAPVWSPDGRSLAYYSTEGGVAQLWVWDRRSRGSRRICDRTARPFFGFERPRWTPDGKRILTKALPEGVTVDEANRWAERAATPSSSHRSRSGCTAVEVGRQRADAPTGVEGNAFANRFLGDLLLVGVDDGEILPVAAGVRTMWWDVSPTGERIAFDEVVRSTPENQEASVHRLLVWSSEDRRTVIAAEGIPFGPLYPTISWSPDGTRLAYTSIGAASDGACHVVDAAGGGDRPIAAPEGGWFGKMHRAPLWSVDGERLLLCRGLELGVVDPSCATARMIAVEPAGHVFDILAGADGRTYWSPDGGASAAVVGLERDSCLSRLWQVNLADGRTTEIMGGPQDFGASEVFGMDVSAAGRRLLYLAEDVASPRDLWVYDHGVRSNRRLTDINPKHRDVSLGRSRRIAWTTSDGSVLHGALLLPADHDPDRRYPMIVDVYPVMRSDRTNRYAIEGCPGGAFTNLQLFASRGYAVLAPDMPCGGPKEMREHIDCVLPGVDAAIELGIADPERLGVIGHSAGGHAVLCLIAQTTRFRAAVASASCGDWAGMVGNSADGSVFWAAYCMDQLQLSPWSDRVAFTANSPFYFLDRVETPLLLIQGGLDTCTPPHLAEQTYAGLKYLGKEVAYVRYEGEDHYPGAWSYANQLDYANRVLAWFESRL